MYSLSEHRAVRKDRREEIRRSASYLRVFSPVPGRILNLSAQGMCLETVTELVPGAECLFRGRLRHLFYTLKCEVVWCRPYSTFSARDGRNLVLYRIGSMFRTEVPSEILETLS